MSRSTKRSLRPVVWGGVFFGATLLSWQFLSCEGNGPTSVVVLPHHGITGNHIENFYTQFKSEESHFDTIFIIAPDHFGLTTEGAESLPHGYNKICYQDTCVKAEGLPGYESKNTKNLFGTEGKTIEHGLGEHITRIARYFPESTIVPIVLKRENIVSKQGEIIAHDILNASKNKKILVIASVDFSHHVREPFAELHDKKSIATLSWGTRKDFSNLEVDCRNCLFIAQKVAREVGKPYFSVWDRTSVDSITHHASDTQNTSHVFGVFEQKKTGSPEAVFLFGGDTHWARDFQKYTEMYPQLFEKIMHIFYQEYDTNKKPPSWYHTILRGFDEVIVNFESTIDEANTCTKNNKNIQFITPEKYIEKFANIGITVMNIGNNHSGDCGEGLQEKLYEIISRYGIRVFGENHDIVKNIYNQEYVFMSLNTIETSYDFENFLERIRAYKQKNIIVIANIHWGQEYEKKQNQKQEDMAHRMVDAGARLVIGHHPHVVQGEEIYDGVPIYYSLGNFVFDQVFPETREGWLVGCSMSREKTTCEKIPLYRGEKDYVINWFPEKNKN